jgi:predicted small lipoprotein YifL
MLVPRAVLVTFVALLTSVLLAGCGSAGPSVSSPPSGSSALPMDQRVAPGDLAGLPSPQGVQAASTPDDFAKLVDPDDAEDPDLAEQRNQDAARVKEAGFVTAAVKNYGNNDSGFGVSVAVQTGSPDQAKAYEQRLYDEEFAKELPDDAVKGTIAGAAASHTLIVSAEDEGQTHTLGLASFVDGSFVYILNAGGTAPAVTQDAAKSVIDAGNALYAKVKDRPAT